MTTKTILILAAALVLFALGGVVGCQTHAYFNPVEAVPLLGTKEVIKYDTVELPVPYPVAVKTVDTVRLTVRMPGDTVRLAAKPQAKDDTPTLGPGGQLSVPIERKTYQTADYRAVVSGWRPALDSMTVYPKTITREVQVRKRSSLSITLGPTAMYDGKQVRGGIGITAGFTILSR